MELQESPSPLNTLRSPLRIGVDCRFASELAGLGTYTRSLAIALSKRDDPVHYVFFVRSLRESWPQDVNTETCRLVEAPFPHYSLGEQFAFPSLIRSSGCDCFLSLQFNVPIACPVPFACTVHDLILHRYPNNAGLLKRMAYRFLFNRSVRRARAVIAVSNATQKDLLSYYAQSSAQKTHVIYPGLDFQHITAVSQSSRRIQRPYILYVGNCKEHKNVPLLLEAYHASGISTSHDLLLVTSGREAKSLTLPHGAQVLSNVPHEDLPVLYGGAAGFATATLMEGFGFPILEAMAQRCPVLATTCGSLPEISAGHALLVQPTLADLSKGLQRLVSDPSFHSDSWLNAAAEHARTFTWERTAEGVVRVLLHAFRSDENCMSY